MWNRESKLVYSIIGLSRICPKSPTFSWKSCDICQKTPSMHILSRQRTIACVSTFVFYFWVLSCGMLLHIESLSLLNVCQKSPIVRPMIGLIAHRKVFSISLFTSLLTSFSKSHLTSLFIFFQRLFWYLFGHTFNTSAVHPGVGLLSLYRMHKSVLFHIFFNVSFDVSFDVSSDTLSTPHLCNQELDYHRSIERTNEVRSAEWMHAHTALLNKLQRRPNA